MRIIGGTVGGRTLLAPRGDETRPTSDKVRQALFDILAARGPAPARVLDLYAGSGALGLEALSRGAEALVAVEARRDAARVIAENARALGLDARCQIACARVEDWLGRSAQTGERPGAAPFGWVFLDPPYAVPLGPVLAGLARARLVGPGGLVVAEHFSREEPSQRVDGGGDGLGAGPCSLVLIDRRRYGQTGVSFYVPEDEATS